MSVHVTATFGTVNLNDRASTFFSSVQPIFPVRSNYMVAPGSGGLTYRTIYENTLRTITANGYWRDGTYSGGSGKRFSDFLTDLQNAAGGALALGPGWSYTKADVIDVISSRLYRLQVDSGGTGYVELWSWSIKFQVYTT